MASEKHTTQPNRSGMGFACPLYTQTQFPKVQ
jgi:hypothetical protein